MVVEVWTDGRKLIVKKQVGETWVSVECETIEEGLEKLSEAEKHVGQKEEQPYFKPHPITIAQWIREYRNKLLRDSDWVVLSDVRMEQKDKQVWLEYRQKLRDLPQIWKIDAEKPVVDLSNIYSKEDIKNLPW